MPDKARVLDALVERTVRDVLFPDLPPIHSGSSPDRPSVKTVRESAKPILLSLRQDKPEASEPPSQKETHYRRVLSYASWSDVQLEEEKRRLKSALRASRTKRMESPEEEDCGESDTTTMEAYALLELFLSERKLACGELDPSVINWRLLHAQLNLYAKYFDEAHDHKILHELDVAPIERLYQLFLLHHSNQ